jgi:hypothetical protein
MVLEKVRGAAAGREKVRRWEFGIVSSYCAFGPYYSLPAYQRGEFDILKLQ